LHSTAVLAENGKLSRLPQIISTYTTSVGSLGKVLVVVTATLGLTKQELEDIKISMKGCLKPGQTLKIEQKQGS
jgi:F-type H+-transporting ATPase subunit O